MDGQDGIRVQLRMLVKHLPDQRFDVNGAEILQLRGRVVDSTRAHPELVVRFSGQRRAELYRWAKPEAHLVVDGLLEVKVWAGRDGRPRSALLVEALSLSPLGEIDLEPSHAGVYAVPGRTGQPARRPKSKADSAEMMRRLLEKADG